MGSYLFVFLIPSLLLLHVSSKAINISIGWTLPEEGFSHFFRYINQSTTYDEAKTICETANGVLFTVETDDRRDAVRAFLKELDVVEDVWCGLERQSSQEPFVWTFNGGGEMQEENDSFWQEPHPLAPERLCVAVEPLHDFRWKSYPCDGPQINTFICQLEVPFWATGPKGCMLNDLPSLTVSFLPDCHVIELLSDCGLSGTKRVVCKGGENHEDLIRKLSCEPMEEKYTQGWSTKTSTPSGFTHSSNTRHKRESGATSPSSDIPLQTEPSLSLEIVPKIPTNEEVTVIRDVEEESASVHQTTIGAPVIRGSTHQLTVKSWLQSHENQLASTNEPSNIEETTKTRVEGAIVTAEEGSHQAVTRSHDITTQTPMPVNLQQTSEIRKYSTVETPLMKIVEIEMTPSIVPISEVIIQNTPTAPSVTSEKPLVTVKKAIDVIASTLQTVAPTLAVTQHKMEPSTPYPKMRNLPPNLIQQKVKINVQEKDEERTEVINQVLDSENGDTEFIQNKEDLEALVQSKSNFDKSLSKDSTNEKKNKMFNMKPTTTSPTLPENVPVERRLEKIIVETFTPAGETKIAITSVEAMKLNPPKLIETVPTLDRPIEEVTSKANRKSYELTEKNSTSENKDTITPELTTTKVVEQTDSDKKELVIDIAKMPGLIMIAHHSTAAPTDEDKVLNEEKPVEILDHLQMSTMKPIASSTLLNTPSTSSPMTSTYWPKIESPPSSARPTSTDRPIPEYMPTSTSKPTETNPFKLLTDQTEASTLKVDSLPAEIIQSTPSTVKVQTYLPIDTTQRTSTFKPNQSTQNQISTETSTHQTTLNKLESTPAHPRETSPTVLELNTPKNTEESTAFKEIHTDVEILPQENLKSTDQEEQIKYLNEGNVNLEESTTEIVFSDLSSEEAENPKRANRGRLFPHSNPLSFYPYFLNRVLG